MKKTAFITVLLLAAAVGLGAYLYLTGDDRPSMPDSGEWEPKPLFEKDAKFTKIVLERPDVKLVFKYFPEVWTWGITEPIKTNVDARFFDMMVGDINRLKQEKIIELMPKQEDLARFALDNPPYKLTVTPAGGGEDVVILIGKMNYAQSHFYAKKPDDPTVFLIKNSFRIFLEARLVSFRSKALYFSRPTQMISIEIVIEDPELKKELNNALEPKLIVQEVEGGRPEWVIVRPVHENSDFDALLDFFQRLTIVISKKVIDVKKEELAEYGLDPPRARVIFYLKEGGQEEVHFGNATDDGEYYYVRNANNPEVVVIKEVFARTLLKTHFRLPNPLGHGRPLETSRLEMEFPKEPERNLAFVKEETKIYFLEGSPEEKSLEMHLGHFRKAFIGVPTYFFIDHDDEFDRAKYGLDPPRFRIKFFEQGTPVIDLSVGDYVSSSSTAFTLVEDNLRGCLMGATGDVLSEIPLEKKYLIATPEEIKRVRERAEKRRGRDK